MSAQQDIRSLEQLGAQQIITVFRDASCLIDLAGLGLAQGFSLLANPISCAASASGCSSGILGLTRLGGHPEAFVRGVSLCPRRAHPTRRKCGVR